MSDLNFSIRIGAEDATKPAIQSAMAGFRKLFGSLAMKPFTLPFQIGRAGLGALRDFNLGLMPLARGLDTIIDKGSQLEVIQKTFRTITGRTSRDADTMAQQIVRAASGTMRMADAMALANRALGTMKFDELLTAVEFISKKSVATGKEPAEALNTVITGLIRGSTLFLDDFGILVDGVDGVKRSYDAIKGSGAFDSLGPAAQKAETIRQALAEMRGQIDRIGVSGKSSFFLWQGIKNQIGDSVDRLVLAVAKSDALKSALQGASNLIRGLADHFFAGKSKTPWQDVFFGKERQGLDGQQTRGGGLLNVLGAGIMDLGEIVGRGILGGLLKGLSLLPDLFAGIWKGLQAIWEWAIAKIPPAIRAGLEWLQDSFIPSLKQTLDPLVEAIMGFHTRIVNAFSEWIAQYLTDDNDNPTWLGQAFGIEGPAGPTTQPAETTAERAGREADERKAAFEAQQKAAAESGEGVISGAVDAAVYGFKEAAHGLLLGIKTLFSGEFFDWATGGDSESDAETENLQARAGRANVAGTLQGFMAQALFGTTFANTGGDAEIPDLWELFNRGGDSLLSGGVFGGESRFTQALDEFNQQFAKADKPKRPPSKYTGNELEHTDRWRREQMDRLRQIEKEDDELDRTTMNKGNLRARREANRRAAEEEADARAKGFRITPSDRRKMRQKHLDDVLRERKKELEEERKRIEKEIDDDNKIRAQRRKNFRAGRRHVVNQPAAGQNAGGAPDAAVATIESPTLEQKLDSIVAVGQAIVALLGGGGNAIAAVNGDKA